MAGMCSPVFPLSVISKICEKSLNDRPNDHLERCDLFSNFQYGFRLSLPTADLLTIASDIKVLGLLIVLWLLEL